VLREKEGLFPTVAVVVVVALPRYIIHTGGIRGFALTCLALMYGRVPFVRREEERGGRHQREEELRASYSVLLLVVVERKKG